MAAFLSGCRAAAEGEEMSDNEKSTDPGLSVAERKALRVRPETSGRIAEFSEHEAD